MKLSVGVHIRTCITMNPLEKHYLNQAGRVPSPPWNQPYLFSQLNLQRGHGIGKILGSIFR